MRLREECCQNHRPRENLLAEIDRRLLAETFDIQWPTCPFAHIVNYILILCPKFSKTPHPTGLNDHMG